MAGKLISSISIRSFGTIDLVQEAANFPDWGKMLFKEYPAQEWSLLLPAASETECNLVSHLVTYESGSRMTATRVGRHKSSVRLWSTDSFSQVLEHPYFVS
jgi:hypothetical protein